jgi:hypothetical protein
MGMIQRKCKACAVLKEKVCRIVDKSQSKQLLHTNYQCAEYEQAPKQFTFSGARGGPTETRWGPSARLTRTAL